MAKPKTKKTIIASLAWRELDRAIKSAESHAVKGTFSKNGYRILSRLVSACIGYAAAEDYAQNYAKSKPSKTI